MAELPSQIVQLHPGSAKFPIIVKYLTGKTITVEVEPSDTIAEFKQKIRNQDASLPSDKGIQLLCLQRCSKPLDYFEGIRTLADFSIRKDDTIHLSITIRN